MSASVKTRAAMFGGLGHLAHIGMRHLTAHESDVLEAGHGDVGNEHAASMEMPSIFLAQQTRADPASSLLAVAHVLVIPSYTNLRAGRAMSNRTTRRALLAAVKVDPSMLSDFYDVLEERRPAESTSLAIDAAFHGSRGCRHLCLPKLRVRRSPVVYRKQ